MISTQEKAALNELRTLATIAKFGVLRSKEVAALAFADSANDRSATVLASRTMKRLLDKNHVGKKRSTLGEFYYITGTGAKRCNEWLGDIGEVQYARASQHISVKSTVDYKACVGEVAVNLAKNEFEVMGKFGLFIEDEDLYNFDAFAVKKRKTGVYTLGVLIILNARNLEHIIKQMQALCCYCNKILIHGDEKLCNRLLAMSEKIEDLKSSVILLRRN